jgi:hypothetical protein
VRAAWGVFYDALAGQGDFFQSGVLAPPFTPLVEVNAPTPISLADPLQSITGSGSRFPGNLTIIGWAEDFTTPYAYHFNASVQQQIGENMGAEIGYVGSRGRNMPIFMEVNPGVWTPGQTTRGRGSSRPTRSCGPRSRSPSRSTTRCRRACGCAPRRASTSCVVHARLRQGSRVGPQHRRRAAADPAGDDWRRGVDSARADFEWGPRCSTCATASCSASARNCRRPRTMGTVVRHVLGGWQLNGIVQKQTGFPVSLTNAQLSIRFLTNRPDQTCDPNENAPHTSTQWFNTSCFVARPLAATGEPGNADPQPDPRAGLRVDRPVALQEHRAARDAPHPAAAGGVQRVQPDAVQQPERRVQHVQLRPDHVGPGRPRHPAGDQVLVLTKAPPNSSQLPTPTA